MKNNPGRVKLWISITIIALLAIIMGYLRDSIFKSINTLLKAWDYDQDYYMPSFLSFLENYEYNTIVNFKWALTLVFSLIFMSIALMVVKLLFSKKKYLWITVFLYGGITVLSGFLIVLGLIFDGTSEKMYEFARYLMGMAQSPIILMILIPAFKISEKENKKTTSL